jgi:hypothetical protein
VLYCLLSGKADQVWFQRVFSRRLSSPGAGGDDQEGEITIPPMDLTLSCLSNCNRLGSSWRGNEEQIPLYALFFGYRFQLSETIYSAYELYADLKGGPTDKTVDMAERFKKTFSRPDVKVHFLGAWCV